MPNSTVNHVPSALSLQRRLLEAGRDSGGLPASERFVLASFDETPYSPFLPSCRYTAAQDAAGLGAAAARLVLDRIRSRGLSPAERAVPAEPRIVRLGTTLIRHHRG